MQVMEFRDNLESKCNFFHHNFFKELGPKEKNKHHDVKVMSTRIFFKKTRICFVNEDF